jgi:hypothetical protein
MTERAAAEAMTEAGRVRRLVGALDDRDRG